MTGALLRLVRVGSPAEFAAAALMLVSYPLMLVAALIPSLGMFAGVAVVSYVSDHFLHRRNVYLLTRLSRARAGLTLRFMLRQLLLVLLLARMGVTGDTLGYEAIACFALIATLQAPHSGLLTLLRNRRKLPVVTRNIDLAPLGISDAAPRVLTHRAAEKVQHLDLFAVTGVLVAAETGRGAYGYAGMGVTLGLTLLYILVVAYHLRPGALPPKRDAVLEWFDEWLRAYRPTLVLYFSGTKESTYQINMWLETLEELDERPLLIVREQHTLPGLASTTVPVACVPSAVHLMNMDLASVRVALYPANVGKNIHLLRVPTMKHVFIGHGDSDKVASINPYAKVYDEVWTAGRAGRDRYALADVGVRDDAIVEVGRPQLAPIRPAGAPAADRIPTILYAPTWEGWTDDPGNTSLMLAGENIVRRLLAADPPVRVLYKPHPFTGMVSPLAKAAHERIVAMVEQARTQRAADPRWVRAAAAEQGEREAARAELTRIEAQLERLGRLTDDGADEAQTSRDAVVDPAREAEAARLKEEWNDAYWRSFGWWEHRVVTGDRPRLYDCFNASHGMVSDISSVVSDFIASGKPYAVTDSAGLGEQEFKRQNTAVRAAVILAPDAVRIDELLAAVPDPAADPLRGAREELKEYLLGPDEPASVVRFGEAVRALAEKSERRNLERAV
ncbi:hypothetical protein OG946_27405 [Streptomyces sp. NBC_01808]|uniref:hypothetical protein n=1 Tax=Streptomyces sp. NBC_01808 TaxID=2975947 RepID=UPI002DDAE320|nr:hypothetical protein [Streptomyces sp. NBC_01808]WSA40775.1 hypothetical protein OG946_27405 [Streptomyces sp. NBC_01808]